MIAIKRAAEPEVLQKHKGKWNRARHIPPHDCVDPCREGVRPEEHLAFDDEIIRAKNESATGLRTIQKYGLSRETLDLKRIRRLQSLLKVVDAIKDRMIESGRKTLTSEELSLLRSFAQPDAPFSSMCGCYLETHGF
ncbi:hypothetical protein [Polyangium sp. 6x1]|uniref:hypothetical protein n=1 Tax=Polyangium sp. 6x1 TaxID=3042689 RepID=UPI002482A747|nr:hypothetical protein [Polyangium sp. 6x1]MDI1444817.1 hypothetical protein [Polyangium sp. 6x1]